MHALCCSPIAQFFCQYLYFILSTSKKSRLSAAKVSELGAYFHQANTAAAGLGRTGLRGPSLVTRARYFQDPVYSSLFTLHSLSIEFYTTKYGQPNKVL